MDIKFTTKMVLFLSLCILFFPHNAHAAPLYYAPFDITQPDGHQVTIYLTGDHRYRRAHDIEGNIIVKNHDTGFYVYADIDENNNPIATDKIVRGEKILYPPTDEPETINIIANHAPPDTFNTQTSCNLVIFINFPDDEGFTSDINHFDGLFNTSGISLRNYFKEASYNQFDINSVFLSSPEEALSNYTAPYPRNNYEIPYHGNDSQAAFVYELELLRGALENADIPTDLIPDYITFVIAGDISYSGGLFWDHHYRFSGDEYLATINDKQITQYNVVVEKTTKDPYGNKIASGLYNDFFKNFRNDDPNNPMDLYPYCDDDQHYGMLPVGNWDIMDIGQGHMSMYMKYKYGGWVQSFPEMTVGVNTIKDAVSSTENAYKLSFEGQEEYFLVEYRNKQNGSLFEKNLPKSGIVVYRVNESGSNPWSLHYPDYYSGMELYVLREESWEGDTRDERRANRLSAVNNAALDGDGVVELTFSDGTSTGLFVFNVQMDGNSAKFELGENPRKLATPTFNTSTYQYYNSSTRLLAINAPAGSTVYYTLDGSTPTYKSTRYSAPIQINGYTPVKAVAIRQGYLQSDVLSHEFFTGDFPEFNGEYTPYLEYVWEYSLIEASGLRVNFSENTFIANGDLFALYDADGQEIGVYRYSQLANKQIFVEGNTIKLYLVKTAHSITRFRITDITSALSKPVITPSNEGNQFYQSGPLTVTLSAGAGDIYYTLDGTEPTTQSQIYTDSFEIFGHVMIKAISVVDDQLSPVLSTVYYVGTIPESAHNYQNNLDYTWTYTYPKDVQSFCILFSPQTYVEDGNDYINIYNTTPDGEMVTFTGSQLAGKSVKIIGNQLRIQLVSDGINSRWGFQILKFIEISSADKVDVTVASFSENLITTKAVNLTDQNVSGNGFVCLYQDKRLKEIQSLPINLAPYATSNFASRFDSNILSDDIQVKIIVVDNDLNSL